MYLIWIEVIVVCCGYIFIRCFSDSEIIILTKTYTVRMSRGLPYDVPLVWRSRPFISHFILLGRQNKMADKGSATPD